MVLNTKQKDLGRSRLSLIFGSWLKLAKLVFLTKTSLCSSGHFVKEIFEYLSFYEFFFLLRDLKKISLQILRPSGSAIEAGGS
jgi:hypothetical protein